MTASVRHELMRRPFTRTVQAPHWPWSHPFLVPVRPRYSRRASSKVVQGATSICTGAPLTVSRTQDFAGTGTAATVAVTDCVFMQPPPAGNLPATRAPGPARNGLAFLGLRTADLAAGRG